MKQVYFLSICFLLVSFSAFSQHHEEATEHEESSHFRMSLGIAHTYVPEKTSDGTKNVILPSIALDIEYWINHHWGIGLHNDVELMSFEVEEHEEVFIEREYPVLITLDALWKPYKELVVFAGPGVEFESSENYFVFRVGGEYEIPISHNWDLSPVVFYDMRDGAYNTFTAGLGVGCKFD